MTHSLGKRGIDFASRLLIDHLKPLLDRAARSSSQPFASPGMLRPHVGSRRYGWTHYGVFFPQLPEPHRYFNVMTLIGMPGALAFDNDFLLTDAPRNSATVFSGTAAMPEHHLRAYAIDRECEFATDGSLLRWGKDLTIEGRYPDYALSATYGDCRVDMRLKVSDKAGWFVRNVLYDHLSLLAEYTGSITLAGDAVPVSGLCTFEYAAALGPHSLVDRSVPDVYKLPLDFFTYQIINLDARTQLLLTDVRVAGRSGARMAHIRSLDDYGRAYDRDVRFEVTEYAKQPGLSPDGKTMRLPERLSWQVMDAGRCVIEIHGTVDTPFRYGHGRGYAGSYRFDGRHRDRPISGRGYIEYVDCRPD